MSEFDLRQTTRRLIADLGDPDPCVVAEKLYEEIPLPAREDVLRGLLRWHVRHEIGLVRNSPVRVLEPSTDLQAASAKWRQVRDIFAGLYHTGESYKALGLFTVSDCEGAKSAYLVRVKANQVAAGRFDRLAAELKRRRKGKASDLPRDLVEEIFS